MGMFDTVIVLGADRERFRCAAGHIVDEDLQTKDLDEPSMSNFYVVRGRLYQVQRKPGRPEAVFDEDRLVIRDDMPAEFITRTVDALVYAHCGACEPVHFVSEHSGSTWDALGARQPWSEWTARFEDGRLVEVRPFRLESRDDVRATLRADGVKLLDDHDWVVQRHRARAERRGNHGRGLFDF